MRLSRVPLPLALGAAALLALPAGAAAPGCYEKVEGGTDFCEQQVWFHQGSAGKLGNASAAQGTFPTWDATAPKASVTSGAGGGFATNGAPRQQGTDGESALGATFKGTYTGALDTLDVTLFLFAPKQAGETYYGGIDLVVDGKTLLSQDVDGLPLASGGSAVLKTGFVLAGLDGLMQEQGLANGEGSTHEVQLFVTAYTLATGTGAFVYDTTEVPAGMVFNTTKSLEGRFVIGGDPEPEEA